jgi:hypothetical protein
MGQASRAAVGVGAVLAQARRASVGGGPTVACAVDSCLWELGRRLLEREEELARAILGRVRLVAPDADRDSDPERVARTRDTIAVAAHANLLRIQRDDPTFGPPRAAWENVRIAAHNGTPLSTTLQSYVTGHLVVWEFVLEEAVELGLGADELAAMLRRVLLLQSTYFNDLVRHVCDGYMRESERVSRGRDQRRAQLVREVLDGGDASAAELGYDLAHEHLGLIVSAARPEELVRELAGPLDRALLSVSRSERTLWAWLGGYRPLDPAHVRRALDDLGCADFKLALGEPGSGVEGFRVTHHQARGAYAVALQRGCCVTRYADVALEALGLGDELLGHRLVDLYLGPLDRDPRRAHSLRETLRAYFHAGQNAASAAAMLGVHERTVSSRLRAAEDLLGHPINARRAELETALRLEEITARPPQAALLSSERNRV